MNGIEMIKKILKRKAVKNGAWLYLLQIFNTVVPLLTLPYITRILGAKQYGVFSIAINVIGYYQVVVEYGFAMSATRKVALSDKDSDSLSKTFSTVFFSRCLLLMVCFGITAGYIFLNKSQLSQCFCLMILMITLFGNCIQLNWLFQGMQQMKYITIVSMISRTITVIMTFVFVKSINDLYLYCLLYAISPVISGILGLMFAKKTFNVHLVEVHLNEIASELKSGWYVFTTQLSSKVFGAIGITFLGLFATNEEVGIYSAIQKIPNILILAWTPITQVLYPISSQRFNESFKRGKLFVNRMKQIFVPLFLLVAIGCSAVSKLLVAIAFGEEYAAKFYWMIPLLLWMVMAIYNNFTGIQTLLASGHDREYSRCFQIGVVVTIVLNFLLVYLLKGDGACIAPLLSEMVLCIMLKKEVIKLEKENTQKYESN